jgi:hypothetical protein
LAETAGPFKAFDGNPSINTAGTVAFIAQPDSGGSGVFTGNGGPTTTIAIAGSLNQPFQLFRSVSMNDAGTVAFLASLNSGGFGIYVGGPATGKVIGSGDALFGSTLTVASFFTEGFNDSGQVAFFYTLADGARGVALATPVPEPSACALLLGGVLALPAGRGLASIEKRQTKKGSSRRD